MTQAARECILCKHVYRNPCNGKNKDCGNYRWIKEGKASLTDDTVTTKKSKKVRVRLSEGKAKPTKTAKGKPAKTKTKKRVRL